MISVDQLMQDIADTYEIPPPLKDGEFTLKMFMEKTGSTKDICRNALEKAERAGDIRSVGSRLVDGKRVKAWCNV